MKPRHSLSDRELLDYADEHLGYEINMLLWTTGIMRSLGPRRKDGPLPEACNNALLNSFALHARNLIDFLYLAQLKREVWPTDIIIQDYIDQQTLAKHLPPITCLLKDAKKKAGKQAAHLTKERIQYERQGKEWQFVQVAADVMKAFRAIAPAFPESKISDSFRELISRPGLAVPPVATNLICAKPGCPIGIAFCLRTTG